MMRHRWSCVTLLLLLGPLGTAPALAADPGGKCAATKLKAAAKKTAAKLKCHAKAAATLAEVDEECLQKAEEKFTSAFEKAEAKGGCITNDDAPTVEQKIDQCVSDLAAMLPAVLQCGNSAAPACDGACPAGQTCTEVPSFGSCIGDVACSGFTCSDLSACPAGCSCTAFPAYCACQ